MNSITCIPCRWSCQEFFLILVREWYVTFLSFLSGLFLYCPVTEPTGMGRRTNNLFILQNKVLVKCCLYFSTCGVNYVVFAGKEMDL
jgi:hypothetical protein